MEKILLGLLVVSLLTWNFYFFLVPLILVLLYKFSTEPLKNTTDDLEVMYPTLNDPYQNNIDSDVLKKLPPETPEIEKMRQDYFHWNYYKDLDTVFDRHYNGLDFYTTPPDDQQAFIDKLGLNKYLGTKNTVYTNLQLESKLNLPA